MRTECVYVYWARSHGPARGRLSGLAGNAKAGDIGEFRRRAWRGTPLYDLQEMGGSKSSEMVRRYAHLAPAQMAKHAELAGRHTRP